MYIAAILRGALWLAHPDLKKAITWQSPNAPGISERAFLLSFCIS